MSPSWHRTEAGAGLSAYMSPHWVEWTGTRMVIPRVGVWSWQDRAMSWLMKLGVALSGPYQEGCELLAGPREPRDRWRVTQQVAMFVRIHTSLCSGESHTQLCADTRGPDKGLLRLRRHCGRPPASLLLILPCWAQEADRECLPSESSRPGHSFWQQQRHMGPTLAATALLCTSVSLY